MLGRPLPIGQVTATKVADEPPPHTHLRFRRERAKPTTDQLTVTCGTRYLAVEMDTMDQEKCALPHYPRPPKCLDDSASCKTHVTAAHVVGVGWQHYLYTNNFAHDANTTVTILHKYVSQISFPCTLFRRRT